MNEKTLSCSFLLLILLSEYDVECDIFPPLWGNEVRAVSAVLLGRCYFMMFPTIGGIRM